MFNLEGKHLLKLKSSIDIDIAKHKIHCLSGGRCAKVIYLFT